jgi:thiazole/oxazole-forming peptide maturase SagD family component
VVAAPELWLRSEQRGLRSRVEGHVGARVMTVSSSRSVRLAPGVALFASPAGLLARSEGRWRRATLSSRVTERRLVERLSGGTMLGLPEDEPSVGLLARAGILIPATPATVGSGTPRFPEHVLVGAPDDARLGARLEHRVRARLVSVVLWIDERGLVAARDEGKAHACPLCAWLWDGSMARYVTPQGDLAECPRAFGDHDRFLVRATSLAQEASELTQGQVWTIDSPTGRADARPVPQHPSCRCIARPRDGARAAPPTLEWSALASARHAAVWPVDAGETTSVARVVYRRSRVAWSTRPEAYGVALGSGPSARIAALAESIERLAMLHAPPAKRDRHGDALEAPPLEAGAVRELLFRERDYATAGFRFAAYDPEASQDWCVATSLLTGRRRVVPASLVGRARSGGLSLVDATSNGYAAHTDRERAVEAALLELLERDAILIDWYAPRGELMRLEGAGGLDGAQTFVMTQDIDVPVVLAVAVAPDGALRSGSAAALTLDDAVRRAHAELAVALTGTAQGREPRPLDDPRLRCEPDDHLAALRGELAAASLARLLARARPTQTSAVRDRWPPASDPRAALLEAFSRAGLEPWVIDRSLPEVFGTGWNVVRALVPGLVELSWGLPYRRLASSRVAARIDAGAVLSSWPHPLA